ncbi:molybdate ABC transporter substrate-binding protein [Paraurantiacibacter namhicola]|uniref:Molybdate-binding periplasmic protein n=1 Tax=Paraurantiacibacter namhicola TaxID=645517 RepID=A0A1C7DBR9_9SPHN|nr:molybdate ABC transporter substrate-binding protein [Paraurantiacibacter namhicola]ANU08761.1 Molybdate-binding periplasmic protein precursor [Paraurantiacibacter namhicola]
MRALYAFLLLACLLVTACSDNDARGDAPVILAAASLQEVLDEAADAYAAGGNRRPVLSFSGTPSIARQVLEGSPADAVVLADTLWMDRLVEEGRVTAGDVSVIAGNGLVLVAAPDEEGQLAPPSDLRPFLAIADPDTVPAGRYAKAALQAAGMWQVAEGRMVVTDNVRSVLALVERGEVPLGVVYTTDMLASGKVREVMAFPPGSHPPIRYPAAMIAGSDNAAARGFLAFLASADGQAIFAKHGFAPAP